MCGWYSVSSPTTRGLVARREERSEGNDDDRSTSGAGDAEASLGEATDAGLGDLDGAAKGGVAQKKLRA
jgi:hypothetical protein